MRRLISDSLMARSHALERYVHSSMWTPSMIPMSSRLQRARACQRVCRRGVNGLLRVYAIKSLNLIWLEQHQAAHQQLGMFFTTGLLEKYVLFKTGPFRVMKNTVLNRAARFQSQLTENCSNLLHCSYLDWCIFSVS